MYAPRRVALVGYGLAGAVFHAPLIDAVTGLKLVAIVVRDAGRREAAARAHPSARLMARADPLWRGAAEVDLVVVATPNSAHVELARKSIEAGLPVIVDKPLATTASDARGLTRLAETRGVMLTVFHNRRWDGDILTVWRLLDEGALGRVSRFESRFERWWPAVGSGWRERDDPAAGGGVLLDLGSHLVDQALWLFGPVREVYAEMDARRPGARVDDDAFIALTHESGMHSHLWMSLVAAAPGPRMRVLGDRAAYVKHGLDVQEDSLRAGHRPASADWGLEPEKAWGVLTAGERAVAVPTEAGAYQRFYESVRDALAVGAPPPVDPCDAVRGLEILEAARQSARTRSVVRALPGPDG
jgi:predicted dehydrogenase